MAAFTGTRRKKTDDFLLITFLVIESSINVSDFFHCPFSVDCSLVIICTVENVFCKVCNLWKAKKRWMKNCSDMVSFFIYQQEVIETNFAAFHKQR